MVNPSPIEWTDGTWNPVRGCSRVSGGCKHCYAEREAARIQRMDRGAGRPQGKGAYDGLIEQTSQGPKWTGVIKLVRDKLEDPLRARKGKRIFVNSMSDMFHEDVPVAYIAEVWAVMAYSRQHTFQILTKRARRMEIVLGSDEFAQAYAAACVKIAALALQLQPKRREELEGSTPALPLRNVWLGVSIEDQATADERVPSLLWTAAAVRFVSAGPLLGPIDLSYIDLNGHSCVYPLKGTTACEDEDGIPTEDVPALDQVIVEGETGPGSRPMHPEWEEGLRTQCTAAGVAYFLKQWGDYHPSHLHDHVAMGCQDTPLALHRDGRIEFMPSKAFDLIAARVDGWVGMCRVGREKAGRVVDGRTWDEVPHGR